MRFPRRATAALGLLGSTVALGILLSPPLAAAPSPPAELVSAGDESWDGFGPNREFAGSSRDGSVVFFETQAPMTSDDEDDDTDLFRRADGETQLVSATGIDAEIAYGGSSADGSTVVFEARERGAGPPKIYVWSAGESTQIGTGEVESISDDGRVVYFSEGIDAVYRWAGGPAELIAGDYDGPFVLYGGSSADGRRMFFVTGVAISPRDRDGTSLDVYEYSNTGIRLVSTGGDGEFGAGFEGCSADGRTVFFGTHERLDGAEQDFDGYDVFARRDDRAPVELSRGTNRGSEFVGNAADGSVALFATINSLTREDRDGGGKDIYAVEDGKTKLVSQGHGPDERQDFIVDYVGSSSDASKVYFGTGAQLTPDDDDDQRDIYLRSGGQTTLATPGGSGDFFRIFEGARVSADGATLALTTAENLVAGDEDTEYDTYVSQYGDVTLMSKTDGGRPALIGGLTRDGSRVFFETEEELTEDDRAPNEDVYTARAPVPGLADRDGDGLDARAEDRLGSSLIDRDSDDDGVDDGVEVRRTRTDPARSDTDGDRLTDGLELGLRRGVPDPAGPIDGTARSRFRQDRQPSSTTDPRRPDSDRDRLRDGREDRNRNGRRDRRETAADRRDTDGDGRPDGRDRQPLRP